LFDINTESLYLNSRLQVSFTFVSPIIPKEGYIEIEINTPIYIISQNYLGNYCIFNENTRVSNYDTIYGIICRKSADNKILIYGFKT